MPLKTLGFGAKPQLKVAAKFRFRPNQDNSINWWYGMENWLVPYAEFLNGPYASFIVNIGDLKSYNKEKEKYRYSKKLLLLIDVNSARIGNAPL